jgi:predicted amidophosphoribosyltransferase
MEVFMLDTLSSWLRWLITAPQRPSFALVRVDDERRCPECQSSYDVLDRYCPGCHTAVPEWRFG